MRQHDPVVLLFTCAQPRLVAERAGACQLGPQVGRDPHGLLVVAVRDADQAGLERVVVALLAERPQLLEEVTELG